VNRIVAPFFYLAYKMQHHFFFRISLRNWLWALVVIPPAAALVHRIGWAQAIALAVLGALLLVAVEWARRQGYQVFVSEDVALPTGVQPPIEVDTVVRCRVAGLFAVGKGKRSMVNEEAVFTFVRSREHILMARLRQTRFLLLSRSQAAESGWWYVFFRPEQVTSVQVGHVLWGFRAHPALAVRYRCGQRKNQEETIHLTAQDPETLGRIWDDLRRDVPVNAFMGN
jgi:hypothetical protein